LEDEEELNEGELSGADELVDNDEEALNNESSCSFEDIDEDGEAV